MPATDWIKATLASFIGTDAITGFILGLLDNSTPEMCLQYIRDDRPLFDPSKVGRFRKFADQVKYVTECLDAREAVRMLADERPDLAGIVLNHPDGIDWLQRQIDALIEELTKQEVLQ